MEIKVCGTRDAVNVVQLCKLPISYIGFIFYPKSSRFVGDDFSVSIANSVPSTINKVGVFVDATPSYVLSKVGTYNLRCVQLHGQETPAFCESLKRGGLVTIKAFGVDESFDFSRLEPYSKVCDYFLFDTKSSMQGGTGQKFDWSILHGYTLRLPIFLSGGISEIDALAIKSLDWLPVHAVDINSKFEVAPGLKDVDSVERFVRALRE